MARVQKLCVASWRKRRRSCGCRLLRFCCRYEMGYYTCSLSASLVSTGRTVTRDVPVNCCCKGCVFFSQATFGGPSSLFLSRLRRDTDGCNWVVSRQHLGELYYSALALSHTLYIVFFFIRFENKCSAPKTHTHINGARLFLATNCRFSLAFSVQNTFFLFFFPFWTPERTNRTPTSNYTKAHLLFLFADSILFTCLLTRLIHTHIYTHTHTHTYLGVRCTSSSAGTLRKNYLVMWYYIHDQFYYFSFLPCAFLFVYLFVFSSAFWLPSLFGSLYLYTRQFLSFCASCFSYFSSLSLFLFSSTFSCVHFYSYLRFSSSSFNRKQSILASWCAASCIRRIGISITTCICLEYRQSSCH